MRLISSRIWDAWFSGGPLIGDDAAPHGRVTVEPSWYLNTEAITAHPPVRWWQREDNSQVEVEVPNITNITIDRSVDQDASTCKITLDNTFTLANGQVSLTPDTFGEKGYFTFNRGESGESEFRWGLSENSWNRVLVPNALLRTYQGYGGKSKTIVNAITDGNICLTGVWLVDEVRINADGHLELNCRDMAKLLIDQQVYPPLMPSNEYPLMWCRWVYQPYSGVAVPIDYGTGGSSAATSVVAAGTTDYVGAVPHPDVPLHVLNEPGNGYWLMTSNGNVYSFGNNVNYGSMSADWTSNRGKGMVPSHGGKGYYTLRQDGYVQAHGDAVDHGHPSLNPHGFDGAAGMAVAYNGAGYWVLQTGAGTVYGQGVASLGGMSGMNVVTPEWWLSTIAISITADPKGLGYWMLSNDGLVQAKGSAVFAGQPAGARFHGNLVRTFVAIRANPQGGGYWVIDQVGSVHAYGTAKFFGQTADNAGFGLTQGSDKLNHPDFADYIADLIPTPSGNGYWLLGVSGGVYPFGDAVYLGGLDRDYTVYLQNDGNYSDYSDIVKELLLWAGWLLHGTDKVFGNIESTGAYAADCLDPALFDKKPIIDGINMLRDIVGYHFWIDDEGAAHFESPNIWSPGNFFEDGTHTEFIPNIDEKVQLTNYGISYTDTSLRSEIVISSSEPTTPLDDTITTRFTPPQVGLLRGMIKPAVWINGLFISQREQELMAELIALHSWLAQRLGQVVCLANPAIQINDQVRIWERQTADTYIHYVRGLHSDMDLILGVYSMTLTTHWMGDGSVWAVDYGQRG